MHASSSGRRARWVAIGGGGLIALAGVALTIAACSDDATTPSETPDACAEPCSDTGAGQDEASTGDAAADAEPPLSYEAGLVGCSTAGQCDRGQAQFCCAAPPAGGAGEPTYTCDYDKVGSCPSGAGRYCDQKADCAENAYCCALKEDSGVLSVACFYGAHCIGDLPRYELCMPGDQCDAGACKKVKCAGAGTLHVCTVPPDCTEE